MRLRFVGHTWGMAATLLFLVLAVAEGVPRSPKRSDWEPLAHLAALGVVALGGLVAWRWQGAGAALITAASVALGVLAALDHPPREALLVALAFYLPGFFLWLDWQRTRSSGAVALLAVALTALLAGGGIAAQRVYDTYFGPVQPVSATAALPPSALVWVWVGGVSDHSVTVKARLTASPGTARLLVSRHPGPTEPLASAPVAADDAAGGIVAFTLSGLEPDTAYRFAIEANGVVDTIRQGRFRTMPIGPSTATIAFGSCASTGSNGAVFDAIRAVDPLLYLVLGDFFYADIAKNDPALFHAAYDATLTAPAQAALYRSVPVAYVWDDHDYGPNDSDATAASRPAAQQTYRAAVPHYPLTAGDGDQSIFQAFTIGRVRYLLTDVRSARSPSSAPDDAAKTMLGVEQKAWLKQELATSARYAAVVWVNPVPWIVAAENGAEGWGSYATERRELADFIANRGITNLVMLSGDAHMLAIDDGSNSDYASGGGAGFPVMHAAALDRPGRSKGGPYSEGSLVGGGQFGVMTVVDAGGPTVEIIWSGRNWRGEEVIGYRFTVRAGRESIVTRPAL